MQLEVLYSDVRDSEELVDFIEKNCCPKKPYILTALYKCNLTQEELDEEYMGLYTPGQTMNNPLHGQISYNSSLSNAFNLKLGHDVKLFLVEMMSATGKDNAKHIMRLAKVILVSCVNGKLCPQLITVYLGFRGIQ